MSYEDAVIQLQTEIRYSQRAASAARRLDATRLIRPYTIKPRHGTLLTLGAFAIAAVLVLLAAMLGPQ